jgi:hypothetical protein
LATSQPQWDPDSPEQWDKDVWRTAAKEKKLNRMTSWLPFFKNTTTPPPTAPTLKFGKHPRRRHPPAPPTYPYAISDSEDSESDSDSDSDDEDWLQREQLKWGVAGKPAGAGGMSAGFQQNVADFMSNGMAMSATPRQQTPGPAPMHGWNVPAAQSLPPTPQSWIYAPPQERQRSPPTQRTPDVDRVAAGMNALGLY